MRKGDLDLLDAVNDDVFELSDRSGLRRSERGIHKSFRNITAKLGKDRIGADMRVHGGNGKEELFGHIPHARKCGPSKHGVPCGSIPDAHNHKIDNPIDGIKRDKSREDACDRCYLRNYHAPPATRYVRE